MKSKKQFSQVVEAALHEAASNAEQVLGEKVPDTFCIHLHGLGHQGTVLDPAAFAEMLYIDGEQFFPIVDLAVVEVSPTCTSVFARVANYPPTTFDKTWNDPPGSGPFKQLVAKRIRRTLS